MPNFEITAPDGTQYDVTGPEGSTKEQALERVKAQHTTPPTGDRSAVGDFFKSIPGGIAGGLTSAASAIGQAEAGQMGMKGVPGAAESKQLLEQNVTGELPKPEGRAGRFGSAVGEVLGNPASYIGPGSLALKAGGGALSALSSEAAGQLTEGSAAEPYARFAGGLAGGTGAGVVAAERGAARLAAELPTTEKIKAAAQAGYEALKKSDVRISEEGTQGLLAEIQSTLQADQFRDYLAPNTFRAVQELNVKGGATIGDLDGVRRLLGRVPIANETDRLAADRAIDAIDSYIANVPEHHVISGDPAYDAAILKHAQANWAAYKRLQAIEKSETVAQHRAGVSGSGANSINTARQEIRKILDSDKKSRGLSQDAKDKMEEIVMGTWATNAARRVGKFAPSGPVSATGSILSGMAAGPAVGAAVGIGGLLSKHLGEYLTDRQIRQLEELMRTESPVGRSVAAGQEGERAALRMTVPAAALRSALAPGATSVLAGGGQ
jgi:hypothetical protein